MIVSANEVLSVAYKAARGGGLEWGAAEDVAVAARWLAERGLPWAPALAVLLKARDALSAPVVAPNMLSAGLADRPLCPLLTGLAVSDLLTAGQWFDIVDVSHPLWLLPFAAHHATATGYVRLTWPGGLAEVAAGELRASSPVTAWPARTSCRLVAGEGAPPVENSLTRIGSTATEIRVDETDWLRLTALEARTYVPASLESRISGAGAGLSDND